MPRVTWVLKDDKRITADVPVGHSLMEAAVANNVPNVIGECGGCLSCATCHVYVDPAWLPELAPPGDEEIDRLDEAFNVTDESRLSCQIIMNEKLDGLRLALAPGSEP